MNSNKLSYRPKEAAEALGLSRETIFDLIKRGDLKSFQVGTARLISAAELERFVSERSG